MLDYKKEAINILKCNFEADMAESILKKLELIVASIKATLIAILGFEDEDKLTYGKAIHRLERKINNEFKPMKTPGNILVSGISGGGKGALSEVLEGFSRLSVDYLRPLRPKEWSKGSDHNILDDVETYLIKAESSFTRYDSHGGLTAVKGENFYRLLFESKNFLHEGTIQANYQLAKSLWLKEGEKDTRLIFIVTESPWQQVLQYISGHKNQIKNKFPQKIYWRMIDASAEIIWFFKLAYLDTFIGPQDEPRKNFSALGKVFLFVNEYIEDEDERHRKQRKRAEKLKRTLFK